MNKNDTTFGGTEPKNDDEVQSSGQREAFQTQQEIGYARAEMSGPLDELHGKFNPTVLKEQAVDQFHEAKEHVKAELKADFTEAKQAVRGATLGRVEHAMHATSDAVKQTGTTFFETMKRNPIPVAMVGVGAAWLLLGRRNGARQYGSELDVMHEPGGEARLSSESLRGLNGGAQRHAGRLKQAASERMKAAGERMRGTGERVQRWKQDAQERGRQLEYRAQNVFEENPLLIGAAVVAVGALLGLAIPITRREDALMGKARDQLVDKAQVRVQGALDKAQGTLDKASETTRRIAGDEIRAIGAPSTPRG